MPDAMAHGCLASADIDLPAAVLKGCKPAYLLLLKYGRLSSLAIPRLAAGMLVAIMD